MKVEARNEGGRVWPFLLILLIALIITGMMDEASDVEREGKRAVEIQRMVTGSARRRAQSKKLLAGGAEEDSQQADALK